MTTYVTHARTLEELRAEFVSDLRRRIDTLDSTLRHTQPPASEAARIARAKIELESVIDFWSEVELRANRKKEPKSDV